MHDDDGIAPHCPMGLSSTEAKMLWLLNDMACVALLSQASLDKDLFIGGSFSLESPAPWTGKDRSLPSKFDWIVSPV